MEKEKENKIREYLSKKGFNEEQAGLTIHMIDQACIKLLEDIMAALDKKKTKIEDE